MDKTSRTRGREMADPKKATRAVRETPRVPTRKAARAPGKVKDGTPSVSSGNKIGNVVAMLRRTKGASIEEIGKTTGWQAHSVRAAISAMIKKKLGLDVRSEKVGKVRRYRIVAKAG